MSRFEQIIRAGYQVKVQWEFDDNRTALPPHSLSVYPVYPGRFVRGDTETMRLNYKGRDGETIQYMDVMWLYPYICKYFKFPLDHPVIHIRDACKDKVACMRMDDLIKCSIVPTERWCTLPRQ